MLDTALFAALSEVWILLALGAIDLSDTRQERLCPEKNIIYQRLRSDQAQARRNVGFVLMLSTIVVSELDCVGIFIM